MTAQYLQFVDFDQEVSDFKSSSIFLFPISILKHVHEVSCTILDKRCFIDWFLENYVQFYQIIDFDSFQVIFERIYGQLTWTYGQERFLSFLQNPNDLNEMVEYLYNLRLISVDSFVKNKELSIPYSAQYENLQIFNVSDSLIEELQNCPVQDDFNKNSISQPAKTSKNSKQNNKKRLEEKANATIQSISKKDKAQKKEHHDLKEKLAHYFDVKTFENKMILEGDLLNQVIECLNQLYGNDSAFFLQCKKTILENNKKLSMEKQVAYQTEYLRVKNLIITDRYVNLLDELETFYQLHKEEPDYLGKIMIIKGLFDEIDGYIHLFLENWSDVLISDYSAYITAVIEDFIENSLPLLPEIIYDEPKLG